MVNDSSCIFCRRKSIAKTDLGMLRDVVNKYIGFVSCDSMKCLSVVDKVTYSCSAGLVCRTMDDYSTELRFLIQGLEHVVSYLFYNNCSDELSSLCFKLETIFPLTVSIIRCELMKEIEQSNGSSLTRKLG